MARSASITGSKVTLGELKIGKKLGEGGFGVVYAATLAGLKFPFAIKFLDPHPFNSDLESARARFFQEADFLLNLRHPHIVSIHGVGEYEGKPYILMERFQGMDLVKARTDHGSPQSEDVLPFVERVVSALEYSHSKNVVHRDVKPKNLMTVRGDCRVLDFGIATLLDPEGSRFTRSDGAFAGDAFSAPELIEDPKLRDPQCDVYSVGACWFWLLTGKAPKGLSWEASLRGAVKVSLDYERVLLRCLEQPGKRYVSMAALASDLRSLKSGGKPKAGIDSPTDEDALVLGIIMSAGLGDDGAAATSYQVEQELSGALTRFALVIALKRLLRFNQIEHFVAHNWNGEEYQAIRVTDGGAQWAEAHQEQIERLLNAKNKRNETTAGTKIDDDIPF